jgi:SAM-dependent methyltransferase
MSIGNSDRGLRSIPREYLARLDEPGFQDFLQYLLRKPRREDSLEVGWRVRLTSSQQRLAAEMNRIYSGLVWGYCDNSYVSRIALDERQLLKTWLSGTVWGANVLEVGCGSGRLTCYLSSLALELTAIEREAPGIKRARARVPARQGLSLKCVDLLSFPRTPRFTCVLLLENVLGMNPEPQQRLRLVRRAFAMLQTGGILIIGFRAMPQRRRDGKSFQAIPYTVRTAPGVARQIVGVTVTWSVNGFLRELHSCQAGFRILHLSAGSTRRVGGQMQYLILAKEVDLTPAHRKRSTRGGRDLGN